MKKILITIALVFLSVAGATESLEVTSRLLPPLLAAVTNNAVVSVNAGKHEFVVSLSGLGAGRTHADTTAATYVFDGLEWREASPVPGGVGRLASVAAAANELVFVFGGYTVAEDGSEVSTPWVHAFGPRSGRFYERQSMPVPVDDAVAVSYRDRFIYLVSGWHDLGNVNLVQLYDTHNDSWSQATPTPGRGVFGHAGGIVGNTIIYCDGVAVSANADRRRDFVANNECFAGIIDADDPRRIDWRVLAPHPGRPRYRMAAAGVDELGAVAFVGGSENPYNYNGIGYNGEPSQPVSDILFYELETQSWSTRTHDAARSMDHRGLVEFDGNWVTVGGMLQDQQVTDGVVAYELR